jgi:hypothetical protein
MVLSPEAMHVQFHVELFASRASLTASVERSENGGEEGGRQDVEQASAGDRGSLFVAGTVVHLAPAIKLVISVDGAILFCRERVSREEREGGRGVGEDGREASNESSQGLGFRV